MLAREQTMHGVYTFVLMHKATLVDKPHSATSLNKLKINKLYETVNEETIEKDEQTILVKP